MPIPSPGSGGDSTVAGPGADAATRRGAVQQDVNGPERPGPFSRSAGGDNPFASSGPQPSPSGADNPYQSPSA